MPNLLVIVLGGKLGQDFASLCPVAEGRHKDSFGAFEVSLQALNHMAVSPGDPGVQFFQHNRAEPERSLRS